MAMLTCTPFYSFFIKDFIQVMIYKIRAAENMFVTRYPTAVGDVYRLRPAGSSEPEHRDTALRM